MRRADRFVGLARSVAIYHLIPRRQRRLRSLYSQWLEAGDLVFDVGAHVGNRTRAFAALGCRVVAVEPQPGVAALLRTLAGHLPDVTVVEAAVSDRVGRVRLAVSDRTPTVSTTSDAWREARSHEAGFAGVEWNDTVDVEATTLDALIAAYGEPAFVKLDVEGAEAAALQGLSVPVKGLSFEYLGGPWRRPRRARRGWRRWRRTASTGRRASRADSASRPGSIIAPWSSGCRRRPRPSTATSTRGGSAHECRHGRRARAIGQQRQPDPRRQPDGDRHRVLRLLHLRHRGGAGLPAAVLPVVGSGDGDAGVDGHIRDRVPGPADRLGAVRALRRPGRPQDHPGRGAADHGRLDGGDWRCCPPMQAIGLAAPLLLAVCRFGQGLGLGGEWGGAILLATENAPPGKRAWYGMFPQLGAPIGFFCSGGSSCCSRGG